MKYANAGAIYDANHEVIAVCAEKLACCLSEVAPP